MLEDDALHYLPADLDKLAALLELRRTRTDCGHDLVTRRSGHGGVEIGRPSVPHLRRARYDRLLPLNTDLLVLTSKSAGQS